MLDDLYTHMQGTFSEPNGKPSSSRLLMFIFSFFSMGIIYWIVYHITHITDATVISIYLSNFPLLISALIGLISLPYGIDKSSTMVSNIATMVTSKNATSGTPKTPAPAMGTPGIKG